MKAWADALARRRPYLVRVALAASVAALVATSPPPTYQYVLTKSIDGPAVELTADTPTRSFLVTLRATELGPGDRVTTAESGGGPASVLSGTIAAAEVTTSESAFVTVKWADPGREPGGSFTAIQSFSVGHGLSFEGDCENPETGSCKDELLVVFSRVDDGAGGGTVKIEWSLAADVRLDKAKAPDHEAELPWDVEIVEQ